MMSFYRILDVKQHLYYTDDDLKISMVDLRLMLRYNRLTDPDRRRYLPDS